MEQKCCQLPCIPMDEASQPDLKKNKHYFKYRYKNEKVASDMTIEQLIEICIPYIIEKNPNMNVYEASKFIREFLPQLKRW